MTTKPLSPDNIITKPGWINQAAKFLSVGAANTLLDAALYFALTRWFGLGGMATLAKGISYSVGILNSYYWNKIWTFKLESPSNGRVFVGFALANLFSLAINASVMYICINTLAFPEALAWFGATGAAFVWNFLISKFVVFRQ